MQHTDRHDQNLKLILIKRRRRQRAVEKRPRPWLWTFQALAVVALLVVVLVGGAIATGMSTALGIYSFYAEQLPDASVIELQQEEFQTVRIYDRTGEYLLYESVDPRPFRGDRMAR